MHNDKNESGFTVLEILMVIATLALIGLAGYFVANHVNKRTAGSGTTSIHNVTATHTTITPHTGTINFTGVEGTVTSASCPGASGINNPCKPSPLSNMTVAVISNSFRIVASGVTDSTGNYKLQVGPGDYKISAGSGHDGYPVCPVNSVQVQDNKTTQSDFNCDSGIR